MTKIIINAMTLQKLIELEPEVSIELAKNAADQVAESFKKKIDTNAMVNKMVSSLSEQLSYRHSHISNAAKEILTKNANEILKSTMEQMAGNLIKEAVRKELEGHKIWIQNNLNGIIIDKVNAAIRASQEAAVKGALR
jgi:hypothetical protein